MNQVIPYSDQEPRQAADGRAIVEKLWPGFSLTEVRAYLYNLRGDIGTPIYSGNKLHHSVIHAKGVKLSQEQVEAFVAAVAKPHTPPPFVAMCYYPRHAFVGFDAEGKMVAKVELCFSCIQAVIVPNTPHAIDWSALRRLCDELRLPIFSDLWEYRKVVGFMRVIKERIRRR